MKIIKACLLVAIFLLSSALINNAFADGIRPPQRPLSQKELQAKDLLKACEEGNLEKVKKLIADGADANGIRVAAGRWDKQREALQKTPLCVASEEGHMDLVKELLGLGADVNKTCGFCKGGSTPLMNASFGGHNEIVKVLLEAGADVNFVEKGIGRSSVSFSYIGGGSALRSACSQGHDQTFKILREAGAKVDKGILISAIEGGNAEIVQTLIDEGEDISFTDRNGRTLLMPYRGCTSVGIVKILLAQNKIDVQAVDKHNRGDNALIVASASGCTSVIPLLLEAGLKVDSVNYRGETPLMFASLARNRKVINLLLEAGADVNAADKEGKTAIVHAAQAIALRIPTEKRFSTEDAEVIKDLLAAGADVNKKGLWGKTPLMFMVEYGITKEKTAQKNLKEIVQLLLKAGADVNAKDDKGNSVLDLAQKAGNKDIIKILKKAGAQGKQLVKLSQKESTKEEAKKQLKRKDKLICLYNKKFNLPQEYQGPNLKIQDKKTGESFKTGLLYNHIYLDKRYDTVTGYGYESIMFYDDDDCNEYWSLRESINDETKRYVNITDVPGDSYLKYLPDTNEAQVLTSESKYYNKYTKERMKDIEDKSKDLQKSMATGNAQQITENLEEFKKVLDKNVSWYRSWPPEETEEHKEKFRKAMSFFK